VLQQTGSSVVALPLARSLTAARWAGGMNFDANAIFEAEELQQTWTSLRATQLNSATLGGRQQRHADLVITPRAALC
jgi:hypothetical protein